MANKRQLDKAKSAKRDEFYTQITDIEKELKHYKDYFKDKIVFCNCDDPQHSNFWKYFELNFDFLGLKKLVSTHFREDKPSYKLELSRESGELAITKTDLKQNGDFRSDESIKILKGADVVVTNPPFSIYREYVAQLMKYEKDFLIIANKNSITYKEVFKEIKNGKIWLGHNFGSSFEFVVPDSYEASASSSRIREDGKKLVNVGAKWFTNIDYPKRHDNLILYKRYNDIDYPKYTNYDAINVDKTKDIPCDYDGCIGVPITFLDKFNPEQFEIITCGKNPICEFPNDIKHERLDKSGNPTGKIGYIGCCYMKHNPKSNKFATYKNTTTGELYAVPYARIIIKRIKGDNE